MLAHERQATLDGFTRIAGIDEAGRGPLAGPVVAAACILPLENLGIRGINDSKQLTAEMRERLFERLTNDSRICYAVGVMDVDVIDRINIFQATVQAMLLAVSKLTPQPDCLLVDGLKLPHPTIPSQKIIGGDAKSRSIAAASILAKVTRDRIMCEYHERWPQYGFDQHKGYCTELHLENLERFGPCPIHRCSFDPVRQKLDRQLVLDI